MPQRRVIGISAIAAAAVAIAATTAVLATGPSEHGSVPYVSRRTFVSSAAGVCVEATVSGTVTGTRTGSAPLARWTDVHLRDPAMTAAGYATTAGRCDHAHPVSLGATLQQTWSTGGAGSVTRRTDQGPAVATLRQFNSGAPIALPDRGLPASVLSPDYPVDGEILIDARVGGSSEGFGYRVHLTLHPGAS